MTSAIVVGGGPAGLMAAEVLAQAGIRVVVHERMPTVGRKFLMAGRGGLNLTHSEPLESFLDRYGPARSWLEPAIRTFPPAATVAWAEGLGQPTFVGSSGRVFPKSLKASPLLRAWLRRLNDLGVEVRTRSHWTGWAEDNAMSFADGSVARADIVVLALGGASWPRLGGDGAWAGLFGRQVAPFRPSNCGFDVPWSDHFRQRFAGQPLKRIAIGFGDRTVRGEATITEHGLEGGAIYALSSVLRDAIERDGAATISIDLRPDLDADVLAARLAAPRRGQSLSTFLRKQAGLAPVAVGLLRETGDPSLVKAAPVRLIAPRPLSRAISSAGGVVRAAMEDGFMLRDRPGVFVAGEMLDWEAPTGGYLLQACFATGFAAAKAAIGWAC